VTQPIDRPTRSHDDDVWIDDGVARREGREPVGAVEADPVLPKRRRKNRAPKSARRNALEWVAVIAGALIIAVVVRTFLFQTFWIPSPSMSPTLVDNDRVVVNKVSYKLHPIHRGDVVVFERPPNEPGVIKDLIKRVVGLPGDKILILDGKVRINNRVLDEPYTHGKASDEICSNPATQQLYGKRQAKDGTTQVVDNGSVAFTIPDHQIFVMGDNRTNSSDSRCFGAIDEKLVVGRAFFIMWPPGKAGGL
jgi:signal peptidase I